MQTRLHYCQVKKSRGTAARSVHRGLCVKGVHAPLFACRCSKQRLCGPIASRFPIKGRETSLACLPAFMLFTPQASCLCRPRPVYQPSYQPAFPEAGFSQSRSTWSCSLPLNSRLQLGGPALPSSHSSWTQGSPGRRWAFSPNFSLSQPLPPQEKPPPGSYLLPLGLASTVHTDWAPALEPGKRDRPGRHLGLVLPLARDLSSEPGEGPTPACSARC